MTPRHDTQSTTTSHAPSELKRREPRRRAILPLVLMVSLTVGCGRCGGQETNAPPAEGTGEAAAAQAEGSGPAAGGVVAVSEELELGGRIEKTVEPGSLHRFKLELTEHTRLNAVLAVGNDGPAYRLTIAPLSAPQDPVASEVGEQTRGPAIVTDLEAGEYLVEIAVGQIASSREVALTAIERTMTSLRVGQIVPLNVTPTDVYRAWELTVPERALIEIETAQLTPGSDPRLTLLRDGEEIASDDDSGVEPNAARILRELEPGTYELRAASNGLAEGRLHVRRRSDDQPAVALAVGDDTTFAIDGDATMAEFNVVIPETGTYRFETFSLAEGGDSRIEVFEDDRLLFSDDDGGDEPFASRIESRIDAGTYSLRVYPVGSRSLAGSVRVASAEGSDERSGDASGEEP